MTIYDYDQTIELLQRAVIEKGDGYIYPKRDVEGPTCVYKEDATPSCIVGHVLSYIGLLDEAIDGMGPVGLQPWRRQFTDNALWALGRAQSLQDKGETWGEALIAAKEVAP